MSFQQLRRRLTAFNTYRKLTHNMDNRFESVKDEEELDRLGHTCIICRDQMDCLGGSKKLPGCGHAFHAHCLREWLVQQQTCPTCRADIAANEARIKKQKEREAAAEALARAAEGEAADDAAAVAADVARDVVQNGVTQSTEDSANEASGAEQPTIESTQFPTTHPAQQQSQESSTIDSDLPEGWTRQVDHREGRNKGRTFYFNKELGKSSWTKPVSRVEEYQRDNSGTTNQVAAASSTAGQKSSNETSLNLQPGFPCLYRVTHLSGAPVFPLTSSAQSHNSPQRYIPRGKLVMCTGSEYWRMPFQENMFRLPDGWVRSRDVERFLMLTKTPEKEEAQMRAVGIAS